MADTIHIENGMETTIKDINRILCMSSAGLADSPAYSAIVNELDPGRVLVKMPGHEYGMSWSETMFLGTEIQTAAMEAQVAETEATP